jgi:hypothetical protein
MSEPLTPFDRVSAFHPFAHDERVYRYAPLA